MTETELRQFLSLVRCGFINVENNFLQHGEGLMSDEAFRSSVEGARFQATFPGMRAAWRQSRRAYGEKFVTFMDALVEAGAITSQPKPLADWRATLTSEPAKIP
jgi:hypothetical protein